MKSSEKQEKCLRVALPYHVTMEEKEQILCLTVLVKLGLKVSLEFLYCDSPLLSVSGVVC